MERIRSLEKARRLFSFPRRLSGYQVGSRAILKTRDWSKAGSPEQARKPPHTKNPVSTTSRAMLVLFRGKDFRICDHRSLSVVINK